MTERTGDERSTALEDDSQRLRIVAGSCFQHTSKNGRRGSTVHCVGFLRPMVWLRQLRGYYLGRVGVKEFEGEGRTAVA